MASTRIEVDHVARIEGHGDIFLTIENGHVAECKFKVTEPARLFESMVRGRRFDEAPYIASRVCGICSSSHTVTDIMAIEEAFGVAVSRRTRALRELLLYGSFIQNHATHLFVFAAPDFMGHKSVFPLARDNRELLDSALGLKALGNELCTVVGGRSIHPITAVVGGFTSEPSSAELMRMADALEAQVPFALSAVDLFCDFDQIELETEGDLLAMCAVPSDALGPDSVATRRDELPQAMAYPVVGSSEACFVRGSEETGGRYGFAIGDYEADIEEYPVDHSAAFLARAKRTGKPYFTSALARINASWDGLVEEARFAAAKAGLRPPAYNPFANNVAQAVELVDSLVRCAASCRRLADPSYGGSSVPVDFVPRAGRGVGFTEAPRGVLIHDLELDGEGNVVRANIVTPTSQNIANLEADMRALAELLVGQGCSEADIRLGVEKLVRAYDPCLSCSVH